MAISVLMNSRQIYGIRYAYHVIGEPIQNIAVLYGINEKSVEDIIYFRQYGIKEHVDALIPYWKAKCEASFSKKIYGDYPAQISHQLVDSFFTKERVMEQ